VLENTFTREYKKNLLKQKRDFEADFERGLCEERKKTSKSARTLG